MDSNRLMEENRKSSAQRKLGWFKGNRNRAQASGEEWSAAVALTLRTGGALLRSAGPGRWKGCGAVAPRRALSFALAVPVLAAGMAILGTAQDAVAITYVSNLNVGSPQEVERNRPVAQAITTGRQVGGYVTERVVIVSADEDMFDAQLCEAEDSGNPTTTCWSLAAQGEFTAGRIDFKLASPITLDPERMYAVVVTPLANTPITLARIRADGEQGEPGWEIGNTFRVFGTNDQWGAGGRGDSLRIAIRSPFPTAPRDLVATPGFAAATLTWGEPTYTSGRDITGYQYRYARGDSVPESATWLDVDDPEAREQVVSNIDGEQQYTFEVRARNDQGAGAVAEATTTTLGTFFARLTAGKVFSRGPVATPRQRVHVETSELFWKPWAQLRHDVLDVRNGRIINMKRMYEEELEVDDVLRTVTNHVRYTVQANDPNSPVAVGLTGQLACDEPAAICNAQGNELSNSPLLVLPTQGVGPSLSLTGSSVPENKLSMLFTIHLSYPSAFGIRVRFRTLETGSATPDQDFLSYDRHILIPPGERTWPVAVWLHEDDEDDPNETVEVEISDPHWVDSQGQNAQALAVTAGIAEGTIEEPDTMGQTAGNGRIWLTGSDGEEGGYMRFVVERTRDKIGELMCFHFETTDGGTATPWADFIPKPKRRWWLTAGQVKRPIDVWLVPDKMRDADETVQARISKAHLCEQPSQTPEIMPPTSDQTIKTVVPVSDTGISDGTISDAGPDRVWSEGELIEAKVRFTEPVTVDITGGTPTVGLRLDGQQRLARYESSAGEVVTFHHRVGPADDGTQEVEVRLDELSLNGGRIEGESGDAFAPPPPQVSGLEISPDADGDGYWSPGEAVEVTLTFTEEVTVETSGGTPSVSVTLSNGTRGAQYVDGSGTDQLAFAYEMTASDEPTTQVVVPEDALSLNGGTMESLDGRPVELSHQGGSGTGTPRPPALVASFSEVPEEHDGATVFRVRLNLSDEIVPTGTPKLLKTAIQVTGGTVRGVSRVAPDAPDRYVRVEPTGGAPITITLPATTDCSDPLAMCTTEGGRLEEAATTTVGGLFAMSIAPATAAEGPKARLFFEVTIDRPPEDEDIVRAEFRTVDGTATGGDRDSGADYGPNSGTVTFPAGETSKLIRVKVWEDAHDEDDETMEVVLFNPEGAYLVNDRATGTITNSGPMPKAWIARFARGAVDHVEQAVKARMAAGRESGTQVTVAGQTLGTGSDEALAAVEAGEAGAQHETMSRWLRGERNDPRASEPAARTLSAGDLLTGTAFSLTGGTPDGGYGALWGRGAVSRFDGREGTLTLDGKIESAMLGADLERDDVTAGLVLSHSRGSGTYRSGTASGKVESSLTGLYPWGRFTVNERLSVWGLGGYGAGSLTLTPEGQRAIETDMDLAAAAVGLRALAIEARPEGGPALAVTSDVLGVRTTSAAVRGDAERGTGSLASATAQVTRLRLGLEGSYALRFGEDATLTPRLEVGVRQDGGDAETGYGLDVGGGVAWSDRASGVSAELSGRGLLTHEAGGFGDRGFAGSLSWDPRPDTERGFSLSLRQTVGTSATGGMDALLARDTLAGLAANDDGDELARRRLEVRLGYGFSAFGDRFTARPELGLGLSNGARDYRLGWRLVRRGVPGDVGALELAVEATRRERANPGSGAGAGDAAPEHAMGLRLTARW